jgi:hypothetical protein
VLGREAKIGRQLRDENFRLEEALQKCAFFLEAVWVSK